MKVDAGGLTEKACATHGDPPGLRATRQSVEEKSGPRWVSVPGGFLYNCCLIFLTDAFLQEICVHIVHVHIVHRVGPVPFTPAIARK